MLNIQNLCLSIYGKEILKNINLNVDAGQVVAVVGESGSGKSLTASSIMQLLPNGSETSGEIWLSDADILLKSEKQMCAVRAHDVGMIFQEPMSALNPLQTIGNQVIEAVRYAHKGLSRKEQREKAEITLHRVGLEQSRFPLNTYPHKLSGGQRQRVVIAIALAQDPKLLIADEPTTALDVTTQAQIMALLKKLVDNSNMGLLLISHDLGVVSQVADHIIIMQDGAVIEQGDRGSFFQEMKEDYTKRLVAASQLELDKERRNKHDDQVILEVKNISKNYKLTSESIFSKNKILSALNEVSFSLNKGENIGLVGESGCGKSTLSRCILALEDFDQGEIFIKGELFLGQKSLRRHISIVFQDPYGSFNPRHKVSRIVAEPFYLLDQKVSPEERNKKVKKMLSLVGMKPNDMDKYPHQFSGGQRQRIAIARALISEPSVIILDEATSALDVLIREQILALLADLSDRLGISYLFISHDLATVKNITDRILVMKEGIIVETGKTQDIFNDPKHLYTKTLLEATPDIKKIIQ